MAKEPVAVTIDRVTRIYKNVKGRADVVAVDDASFVVKPGELVTLLGPSGCGKTTTLRMIAGFDLPTKGTIRIGGEDVSSLPPNKRDTATVFQSYGLFPHMNVAENVGYGLRIRKVARAEIDERVKRALALTGLADYAERSPGRLSGGQQQRVALSRSLVVEPGVLLLDEPLSNLDALLREQMRVEIRRIQKSLGITAIYVTHDRVEAMSLSDRVIVMKDGRIRQIGSPSGIYERPDTVFVAGFVGKVAFFPVEVASTDGETCACTLRGKTVQAGSRAPDVARGKPAVLMARPESLRIGAPDEGVVDGTVRQNVYLGSSIESFVETEYGELLVQIDDPAGKRIAAEGDRVSVSFNEAQVRVLPASAE
ncbi:MAG: polyamine ABC transporter ATP-binding protein [Spirochaetae bacterium HGW-Spirochaetae-7]|jgi:iron(III) transport system ATP-binding protein|nr:MAG: polyamine ABC transporter ATP-binding protein [Spirochaetae bacterium HGW-Spirochaetae-7]